MPRKKEKCGYCGKSCRGKLCRKCWCKKKDPEKPSFKDWLKNLKNKENEKKN